MLCDGIDSFCRSAEPPVPDYVQRLADLQSNIDLYIDRLAGEDQMSPVNERLITSIVGTCIDFCSDGPVGDRIVAELNNRLTTKGFANAEDGLLPLAQFLCRSGRQDASHVPDAVSYSLPCECAESGGFDAGQIVSCSTFRLFRLDDAAPGDDCVVQLRCRSPSDRAVVFHPFSTFEAVGPRLLRERGPLPAVSVLVCSASLRVHAAGGSAVTINCDAAGDGVAELEIFCKSRLGESFSLIVCVASGADREKGNSIVERVGPAAWLVGTVAEFALFAVRERALQPSALVMDLIFDRVLLVTGSGRDADVVEELGATAASAATAVRKRGWSRQTALDNLIVIGDDALPAVWTSELSQDVGDECSTPFSLTTDGFVAKLLVAPAQPGGAKADWLRPLMIESLAERLFDDFASQRDFRNQFEKFERSLQKGDDMLASLVGLKLREVLAGDVSTRRLLALLLVCEGDVTELNAITGQVVADAPRAFKEIASMRTSMFTLFRCGDNPLGGAAEPSAVFEEFMNKMRQFAAEKGQSVLPRLLLDEYKQVVRLVTQVESPTCWAGSQLVFENYVVFQSVQGEFQRAAMVMADICDSGKIAGLETEPRPSGWVSLKGFRESSNAVSTLDALLATMTFRLKLAESCCPGAFKILGDSVDGLRKIATEVEAVASALTDGEGRFADRLQTAIAAFRAAFASQEKICSAMLEKASKLEVRARDPLAVIRGADPHVLHKDIASGIGQSGTCLINQIPLVSRTPESGEDKAAALACELSGKVALITSVQVSKELVDLEKAQPSGNVPVLVGKGEKPTPLPDHGPALRVPEFDRDAWTERPSSGLPLHAMLLLALLAIGGHHYLVVQNTWAKLPFLLIEYEFFVKCGGQLAYASEPVFQLGKGAVSASTRFASLPVGVAPIGPFPFVL
jgi:hypothetical protein